MLVLEIKRVSGRPRLDSGGFAETWNGRFVQDRKDHRHGIEERRRGGDGLRRPVAGGRERLALLGGRAIRVMCAILAFGVARIGAGAAGMGIFAVPDPRIGQRFTNGLTKRSFDRAAPDDLMGADDEEEEDQKEGLQPCAPMERPQVHYPIV